MVLHRLGGHEEPLGYLPVREVLGHQLGATIVMGPGDVILYEDHEDHAGDHADLDEVIAAIPG